jgi:phage-related protein
VNVIDVLEVAVKATGVVEANRAIESTENKLGDAERAAVEATDKVERFGRTTARPTVELQAEGLKVQIEQAKQRLDELARAHPSPEVTVQTGKAAAELDKLEAKLKRLDGKTVTTHIRVTGADKAGDAASAAGGSGGGVRDAQRALDGFANSAGGATATLGGFRIALAALVPIGIGFGGAMGAAASSLGPLIGLAAAAGNALAAAGQGMGVFQLATFGVIDALKEQVGQHEKAGGAAANQAGQARAAARAIQSAQEGVRTATVALSDAQVEQRKAVDALPAAYTAARMHLTDLRHASTDATLALQDSKLAALDAWKAFNDLASGPDPQVLADAHTAVRDAVRGEDNAVQSLRDAYQALNDLLQPPDVLSVADAQDAVADALRNQDRAALNLNDTIAKTNAILADPSSTADAQARARLDLRDAENAVGDAVRGSEHARRSLSTLEAGPAQAAIDAARRRVADAEASVQGAAEGTAKARRDLAKTEAPASALDLAKARMAVADAENAIGGAQRDRVRAARELAAAESAGISRSAEVVAAQDAITKANRGVADAARNVKQAELALSDAQLSAKESAIGAAAASADLNKKFNSLPPAAKAFVRVLQSMKPKLDELRATAASGFFPGATEGLKAAAQNFDSVNKVVGETATVLGEAARKSGELVGSPAFGRDLETIGGRNAKVLDTLGEALRHVVSALRYVALAAGPLTQHLADMVLGWTKTAASAAKAGEQTGRLAHFFQMTEDITKRLLSVLGHLGSGLLGIGKAGKQTGDGIWVSIDRAAKRFDEWANSVGGQSAIRDFFQKTKDLAAALVPVLAGVTSGIGYMTLKALPLTAAIKLLGPYADEATVAFIAFKVATTGLAAAQNLAAFASKAWAAAQWLLNAAMTANPIGVVIVAIGALIAVVLLATHHSEAFRDVVTGAWNAIKAVVTAAVGVIVAVVTAGWAAVSSVTSAAWTAVRGTVASVWSGITSAVSSGVAAVRTAIESAWSAVTGATSSAWGAVSSTVTGAASAIATAVKDSIGGLRDWLSGAWGSIKNAATDAWDAVKSAITGAVRGAVDTVRNLVNDFEHLGGDIVRGIAKGITDAASDVINAIGDVVKGAVKHAKNLLGIGSPSKVFAQLGVFTGQGFAQGVTAQVGAAQDAVARLVAAPGVGGGPRSNGTTAAAAPAGSSGVRTGPVIVQNIERYVVGEQDDNAVAARLAWLMDTAA